MPTEPTSAGEAATRHARRLNLGDIVTAATAIADEEGIAAVSMRRVAERLGHAVMSLYRHIADKERLLALATDAVFAEEEFSILATDGWRERLQESARRQWRCYMKHPWIASVISLSRPSLGPNGVREMEWAFEGMHSLRISDVEKLRLYLIVVAFVHGAAGQMAMESSNQRGSGQAAQQWWSEQAGVLRELFADGQYPNVSRLRGGTAPEPEEWFEFGLDSLLDGLALKLPR